MNDGWINSEQALRRHIKAYAPILDKRIQAQLDHHCKAIIDAASVVALQGISPSQPLRLLNIHRKDVIVSATELRFPDARLALDKTVPDNDMAPRGPQPVSLLFLVPGTGHCLRAKGQAYTSDVDSGQTLRVNIEQVYVHCSRAAVRSGLWSDGRVHDRSDSPRPDTGTDKLTKAHAFIAHSPYLLLGSRDEEGGADISPRGGPPGFVRWQNSRTLLIPEYPGNRVARTLRNIIANDHLQLLFLQPHNEGVVRVSGQARISCQTRQLESLKSEGKTPRLCIELRIEALQYVEKDTALAKSLLWEPDCFVPEHQLAKFSDILAEHMNGRGVLGKATSLAVRAVVRHDLKHLY